MAFWPMGPIFRRAGTVFIRRNTRGNPVYTFTFREYIGYLIEKRFSLQFYVEGGRSRTGKLLPPRLGLLAYVADAYRQGAATTSCSSRCRSPTTSCRRSREFARESKGGSKSAESIGLARPRLPRAAGTVRPDLRPLRRAALAPRGAGPPGPAQPTPRPTTGDWRCRRWPSRSAGGSTRSPRSPPPRWSPSSLLGRAGPGADPRTGAGVGPRSPGVRACARGLPLDAPHGPRHQRGRAAGAAGARAAPRRGPLRRWARTRCTPSAPTSTWRPAFYRNTVIHFFLHGAAGAGRPRPGRRRATPTIPLATFWDAVLAGRDLLKFEFFFEPREEFCRRDRGRAGVPGPGTGSSGWRRARRGPRVSSRTSGRSPPTPSCGRSWRRTAVVAATLVRHEGDELDEKAVPRRLPGPRPSVPAPAAHPQPRVAGQAAVRQRLAAGREPRASSARRSTPSAAFLAEVRARHP